MLAEFHKALSCLFHSFGYFGVRLGVELVGIAYHLLFYCLGHEVYERQGQLALNYLFFGDAGACMPFAYACMPLPPQLSQSCSSYDAMLDVCLVAMSEDCWCVGHEYADIVQHGTIKQEIGVYVELRVAVCYLKSLSCHVGAMAQQESLEFVIFGIKLVNYFLIIHRFFLFISLLILKSYSL